MSKKETNEQEMTSSDAGQVQVNASTVADAAETMNADLDNIFDDDHLEPDGSDGLESGLQFTALLQTTSSEMAEILSSSGPNGTATTTLGPSISKVRSPADIFEHGYVWQDEESDGAFRKSLIVDIASLLKERKVNPTDKWVKELPYKARKLEEQLYRTASSLEAYLDKSTLKHRLKTVAHAITSQFKLVKNGRKKEQSSMKKRDGPAVIPSDLSIPLMPSAINNNLSVSHFESLTQPRSGTEANQNLLQEQILENIRQQQLIMKSLMMSQVQPQIGNLQNIPFGDAQNSMTGFGQTMHGGQLNNINMNVENMLLMQQAQQMGYNGAGINMNMGNSLPPQQLSMMNNMGLGFGMGSTGGMHGMMGVNQLNGINSSPMFQNQQMMRNSFTDGSLNVSTMMAMTQASIADSIIPGSPMMSGMNSGVHPTMPPPSLGISGRSSFNNGSGNAGMADENLSLSPNSFNW